MARLPFIYNDHIATLDLLVDTIRSNLTPNDRALLVSFEAGDPDWSLFPIDRLKDWTNYQGHNSNCKMSASSATRNHTDMRKASLPSKTFAHKDVSKMT